MAYNTSDGPREVGDLKNEKDTDTQLDWDYDYIGLKSITLALGSYFTIPHYPSSYNAADMPF